MLIQSTADSAKADPIRTKPYRAAEVAALMDVDETTIYREIKAGRLRAFRIGTGRGTLRIPVAAFAEYEALSAAAALAGVA